jgi:ATP-binding cassette, subfamily B, bacterial
VRIRGDTDAKTRKTPGHAATHACYSDAFMSNTAATSTRFLRTYLAPQRGRLLVLFALMGADLALLLLLPDLTRRFIDGALAGEALRSLLFGAASYLGTALAANLVGMGWQYLSQDIGLRSTNTLRSDLARHCLKLDMSFHNARTPGEMIERVDGDVGKLTRLLSSMLADLTRSALLIIGALVLLIGIDWRTGLPIIIAIIVCAFIVRALARSQIRANDEERQATADLMGFVEERLTGTEDIRANGATGYVLRKHIERSRELLRKVFKAALFGGASWRITVLSIELSSVAAIAAAALLYLDGALTLGQVYAVFAYTAMLMEPIQSLMRYFSELAPAFASVSRVQALFNERSQIAYPDQNTAAALPAGALAVQLRDVTFAYPGDDTVLAAINLALQPGQTLGVIGRTGSGKTTLTRLLLRLYDPVDGAIRLGDVDLRQIDERQLRARVAIVTQDVQLFSASVRDNVALFDPAIDDARIRTALSNVGLDGWLGSLPNGLDTTLAAAGVGLSAGEAQLLAFARAFVRDPGIVILDEASSRLDPATEARLSGAVDALLSGRTGIVIAHRLQTLDRVDQVLLLDGGKIAEYGSRETLARTPQSQFAQLLRLGIEDALV